MEVRPREIENYLTEDGKEPFDNWLNELRDVKGRAVIRVRLARVETGNFGDCAPVGDGVLELRIAFGPGYRIYFGEDGDKVVLLCGGDKSTQTADIATAKERWSDYNA
jgi:putative addiction module killer protein